MNNIRRKALDKLVSRIQDIRDELESIKYEEEECYENIPEGLKESERAEASQEAASSMECAIDYLDSALDEIESAIG